MSLFFTNGDFLKEGVESEKRDRFLNIKCVSHKTPKYLGNVLITMKTIKSLLDSPSAIPFRCKI